MEYMGQKLRHEKKYYINYADYISLRQKLKQVLKLDKFANKNGDYFIRSLYFDDIYNSALFEKESGIFKRCKYRIRSYDMSDRTIKLEKKSKFGEYISKTSEIITKEEYYKIMNGELEFLLNDRSKLKRDFYLCIKGKHLRPKVVVDYDREAYVGDYSDIRITFDKQLRVSYGNNDIFDSNIVTKNIIVYPKLILEVKYNSFLPEHIRNIVAGCFVNQSAVSKYVHCRMEKNNLIKWG